jgi:hypothetical protein
LEAQVHQEPLKRPSEPGDKLHLSLQSRAVTKRLNLMYYEEPQNAPGSTSQTGLPYAKKKKKESGLPKAYLRSHHLKHDMGTPMAMTD